MLAHPLVPGQALFRVKSDKKQQGAATAHESRRPSRQYQMYLVHQFSGGGTDKCHWTIALLQRGLVLDVPQHGQHKGQGFARPCLCDAYAVPPRHDDRKRLGLQATACHFSVCLCCHTIAGTNRKV